MVKYALACQSCHSGFEAWFSNSDAFDEQKSQGFLACPECGSAQIVKQIMAPSVSGTKKRDGASVPASAQPDPKLAAMMKEVRDHIASTHEYVGSDFATRARAMHSGEADAKPVWGETTLEEAKSLAEEGVPALPLPEPFTPPKPVDQKKLN
ncbi:MAG: hypothetical protein CMK09_18610 [Ponticaulis sp.]|nr:hypothetical protein [Ponticaulis sp.]|tara:strand:- start:95469 stop:95924 length:456 start_codon:yes stop_codon:yes gene_type:complete